MRRRPAPRSTGAVVVSAVLLMTTACSGPVSLDLMPTWRDISCPRCGSASVDLVSEFGATACKALYRCADCLEPFEHVKEI